MRNNDAHFWHAANDVCLQHALQAYSDEGRQAATVRHYYYKLLSSGALRKLPQFANSGEQAYNWVSRFLTTMRDDGKFPWEAVVDNGRRASTYYWYTDLDWYAYTEASSGYKLDPWRGQKNRPEIIVEKDGLVDMVASYVSQWRIPVRSLDGFNSTTKNKALADRYGTGKHYTLLCIGDFDPSGILIPATLKTKLNQYGSYPDIRRIALTHSDTLTLPAYAAVDISLDNPHAKEFRLRYPDPNQKGYEIEALTPTQLRQKVTQAITPYIDQEAFMAAVELEKAVRKQVGKMLKKTLKGYTEQTYEQGIPDSALSLDAQLRYFLEPADYVTFLKTGHITTTKYYAEEE